jgi:hypothetical protein
MIPISRLFLINEIGPILGPPFRNSIMSTVGQGPQIKSGRAKPGVGLEVEKIKANKDNIVKPLPKDQLGMKPSRISS